MREIQGMYGIETDRRLDINQPILQQWTDLKDTTIDVDYQPVIALQDLHDRQMLYNVKKTSRYDSLRILAVTIVRVLLLFKILHVNLYFNIP